MPACSLFQSAKKSPHGQFDSDFTKKLFLKIQNTNSNIKSFKGTGGVKIDRNTKKSLFRLAWMGLIPLKLRLAILSSGHLIETISTDGEYIYLRSNNNSHPFYKHKTSDPNLDKVLEIPIKITDLINLMCGKIPIADFNDVHLLTDISDTKKLDKALILQLEKDWYGVVEKIYIDKNMKAYKVEFFDRNKKLIYCAEFKKMQNINGYLLHALISITNGNKTFLSINIDKIYLNPKLAPSKFVLTEQ